MPYNPKIHHRRSIRLKGYDYSQAGLYFITICVQGRVCLFGNVVNGEMILNDAGKMVNKWYFELENKYPDKQCHEMVVMPNHFHCIIENKPISDIHTHNNDANDRDAHVGTSPRGRPECVHPENECVRPEYGITNKKCNATVGDAMDWFKTMTTNEYIRGVKSLGWERFNGRLWQINYYEHIIRNEESYLRISNYIRNNPAKWKDDKFFNNDINEPQ